MNTKTHDFLFLIVVILFVGWSSLAFDPSILHTEGMTGIPQSITYAAVSDTTLFASDNESKTQVHNNKVDLTASPHQYSSPSSLDESGAFPGAVTTVLLADTYPTTTRNESGNSDYKDVYTQYPQFSVRNTQNITNNIRYPQNPEIGKAIPAEFNNTFYKTKSQGNNYADMLPPAPLVSANSVRVNYFTTPVNLFLSPQAGPELSAF